MWKLKDEGHRVLPFSLPHPLSEIQIPSIDNAPFELQLLKTCLDVGFYGCLVPYKFVGSSTGYHIATNSFQKCCTIFVHLCVWIAACTRIIQSLSPSQDDFDFYEGSPKVFYLSLDFMSNFYLLFSTFFFWNQKTKSAFEWMLSINITPETMMRSKISIIDALDMQERNWKKWLPPVKIFMPLVFFTMSSVKCIDLANTIYSQLSFVSPLFLVTMVLSALVLFFIHFSNMLFLVLCAFVNYRVELFVKEAPVSAEILEKYFNLKKDFKRINSIFRIFVLLFNITGLPFLCLEIRRILLMDGKLLSKFMTGIYILNSGISLELAARGNYKMEKVRDWFSKEDNLERTPPKTLMVLLHELACDNIGLQGGKFFVISYRFIASITGIIVTYTVIILQWSEKKIC